MQSQKKIAVVGAGIAGLAAAYELKKAGFQVRLFEAASVAGGRMRTTKKDGWIFDAGADFLQDNYHCLKSYVKEFNIGWKQTPIDTYHRMIRGGKAYPLEIYGVTDVLKLSFLSLRARLAFLWWCAELRFGKTHPSFFELSKLSMHSKHEKDNAHEYLSRKVSPEVATYIADAFTSIMQFHRASDIDVEALNALMQIFMRPHDTFSIRYTTDGIAEIPRRLGEVVGVILNHPVRSIKAAGGGVLVDGEKFDACVVATTAEVAAQIIADHPAWKEFLHSVQYAPTTTLSFRLPTALFPARVHHSYVAFKENPIIGGYTNENKKPGVAPHEHETLMNVYLHEEAAKKLAKLSDRELAGIVLKELPKVLPEIAGKAHELTFHDIHRWERAMPKFTAAHIRHVKTFEEKHQGEGNIFLIGDYMNAPWTEGAARSGKRVAELIAKKYA